MPKKSKKPWLFDNDILETGYLKIHYGGKGGFSQIRVTDSAGRLIPCTNVNISMEQDCPISVTIEIANPEVSVEGYWDTTATTSMEQGLDGDGLLTIIKQLDEVIE
jgi:hypothetical protein